MREEAGYWAGGSVAILFAVFDSVAALMALLILMNGPIDVEGLVIKLKPLLDRRFAWPHEFLIYQLLAIAEDNGPVACPG